MYNENVIATNLLALSWLPWEAAGQEIKEIVDSLATIQENIIDAEVAFNSATHKLARAEANYKADSIEHYAKTREVLDKSHLDEMQLEIGLASRNLENLRLDYQEVEYKGVALLTNPEFRDLFLDQLGDQITKLKTYFEGRALADSEKANGLYTAISLSHLLGQWGNHVMLPELGVVNVTAAHLEAAALEPYAKPSALKINPSKQPDTSGEIVIFRNGELDRYNNETFNRIKYKSDWKLATKEQIKRAEALWRSRHPEQADSE